MPLITSNDQRVATSDLLPPELLARLERMELVSRKIFRGRLKGERRSRRKGQSVEFMDYRDYVPGDDLRFLDWNLYARLERLFIKLFLEEEELHFYALIDSSASMGFGTPTKLRVSQQIAAALGFIGLCHADRVKLHTLTGPASVNPPVLRGRASVWRMMEYLEAIEPFGGTSLAESVRRFCLRNTGKGIVILLSDLLDKSGYEAALRMLLAQQYDIYVIHIFCREELQPELAGDLKLVDSEDQDVAEVTISHPLLQRYRRTVAKFIQEAKEFCTRRGIAYLMTDNQQAVERLVSQYLRERGLVR
ncbi:MAG: hypothetical protein KatS3mg110_3622 [Pirellulaceae bacterium]|nr:MAG: hypothetical protein KatS3mg110_3622 [Pirellulaceae bacterium]